jgi:hypothetical protein
LLRPFVIHTFRLSKAGNSDAEYEDASATGKWRAPATHFGAAIADGATEGMLSGMWARLLVRRFVRQMPEAEDFGQWIKACLRAWEHEKHNYLEERERKNKPVQWYEEPGLEAGAFAALLGLVFTSPSGEREAALSSWNWDALAVGDCFLAQVRDDTCVCMFPFDESAALNNRPFLLSSNPTRNKGIEERFVFTSGEARQGDHFYLMTDALAGWFLRAFERGAVPWGELDTLCEAERQDAFAEWANERRDAHEMRNDDVTLVRIEIP